MNCSLFDNKFELLECIGYGGLGNVWRARNVIDDYYCAIKILKDPVNDTNSKAFQAFIKEFQFMRRAGSLGHPGIPQVYNIGICNQEAYIEMSYYKGESIYDILSQEKILPFNEIVLIFKDILSTMSYLHVDIYKDLMNAEVDKLKMGNGRQVTLDQEDIRRLITKYSIVHNDIHSKQFIRNHYTGKYVLLDYGLAIQGNNAVRKTQVNGGTPGYSAPEKVRGTAPDTRTDVFALGALMYECLTGDVPFPDDNYKLEMASVEEKRAEAFNARFPGKAITPEYMCPEWLIEVITKCLSFDPQERYPNAKDLLMDYESKLAIYQTKKPSGLSAQEQDVIERQRLLLESKDRRIATQQELLNDGEQQIAKLDMMMNKTKTKLQVSMAMADKIQRKIVCIRRSRNIGWLVGLVLAFFIAKGFIDRSYNNIEETNVIEQMSGRINNLMDSISVLKLSELSKDNIIDKAKQTMESLEQKEVVLNERIESIINENSIHTSMLKDSLLRARNTVNRVQKKIDELEAIKPVSFGNVVSSSGSADVYRSATSDGWADINIINDENQKLRQELINSRKVIDALTSTVNRYKEELMNMAKNL